jgi:hypothetical protein
MRFISPVERYRIICVHDDVEVLASGQPRVLSHGYTAEFVPGDTTDWERELARKHFKFRNIKRNMDGTEVDPIGRVSSFDTAKVADPTLRDKVEKALLANPDNGHQEGYILAERPQVAVPWPTYDENNLKGRKTADMVAAQNIETAKSIGVSLDALIAYERQNRDNAEIIALYEAANAPEVVPEDELVEA